MKCSFFLSAIALLLPVTVAAQVTKPAATDAAPAFSRYEVFGGVDYSGANQVKGSSALIGGNFGVNAKLTKWFGGVADFGTYTSSATSNGYVKPNQTTLLAGPEFSIPADNLTGFLHVMIGGAHTGGVTGGKPDISFAYGVGGGFEYMVKKNFAIRISGDGIVSSFVADPNNQGFTPHSHVNARASAGIAYHF